MKSSFKGPFVFLLLLFIVCAALGIYYITRLQNMLGDTQAAVPQAAPSAPAPSASNNEHIQAIASLEARNAALERDIQTFSSQGADQTRVIQSITTERDTLQRQLNDSIAERNVLQGRIAELQRQLDLVRALLDN